MRCVVLVWCIHVLDIVELVFGVARCSLFVQGGIVRSLV